MWSMQSIPLLLYAETINIQSLRFHSVIENMSCILDEFEFERMILTF